MESRIIKFRAWDSANDVMITPNFPYIGAGSGALDVAIKLDGKTITPNSYGLDYGFTSPPPELIMMQYTGLTDKNGKEIYEGDIIQKEYGVWGVIVYKAPSFEVTVSGDQSSLYTAEWIKDSVVKGNIYQNHELLTN